jgi:hypothetical protein
MRRLDFMLVVGGGGLAARGVWTAARDPNRRFSQNDFIGRNS